MASVTKGGAVVDKMVGEGPLSQDSKEGRET